MVALLRRERSRAICQATTKTHRYWIPACAGMTSWESARSCEPPLRIVGESAATSTFVTVAARP